MTPENYKIQVLLRTEGFFRQQKNSRVISKIDSTTGSVNRYETGLGPLMGVAVVGVEHVELIYRSFSMESVSGLCQNWRLVAGGGNRQVKLRSGSNVLIVTKFNS